MFILQAEQVSYCALTQPQKTPQKTSIAPISGLEYQHKLYVKGQVYRQDESQTAIQRARQEYLDNKGQAILLVEDGETITLWYQDKTVQKADLVLYLDLKEIVAAMRNVGGLQLKDRQFHLKTYARCFVGSEAVDWLVSYLNIPRAKAVQIGQRLIDENWIHHVADEQSFQDDYFFYRFYWDE